MPRFSLTSDRDVEEASKGVVPVNTERANTWALKKFEAWVGKRNAVDPQKPIPDDLLSSNDPDMVCKWIQTFVMETQQESGEPYPPKSLHVTYVVFYCVCWSTKALLATLWTRRMLVCSSTQNNPMFSSLHAQGVGASTTSGSVITMED